jgi:hypothetical protein
MAGNSMGWRATLDLHSPDHPDTRHEAAWSGAGVGTTSVGEGGAAILLKLSWHGVARQVTGVDGCRLNSFGLPHK